MSRAAPLVALVVAGTAACSDDSSSESTTSSAPTLATATTQAEPGAPTTEAADDRFPDVVDATATFDDNSMTWSFAVTMSSPYDTPERYADGWRVMTLDGVVLGTHTLMHDHASEQPFTRTQRGVEIPDDVGTVVIEGRDLVNGFGGTTATITLDRS